MSLKFMILFKTGMSYLQYQVHVYIQTNDVDQSATYGIKAGWFTLNKC